MVLGNTVDDIDTFVYIHTYIHTMFYKVTFAIWPNSQNFYITKCSPLKDTGLILSEITKFSSAKFSCYVV